HRLEAGSYPVLRLVEGAVVNQDVPALSGLNMRLRDDYVADCNAGLTRWNRIIEGLGIPFALKLPHVAFHRHIGEFKEVKATPEGRIVDDATWEQEKDKWLPSKDDGDFIQSLMRQVVEPGKFASWIAPPRVGIDNKPGDFEYVKLAA
ncbi:MAG: benzoyl-CoA 2,3-epoxidase subunit BoxB, partial [Hyphomicrobiales bacterium]|nr:benzoyl-CoA 2,3-epoxidase subunit BoxB [Hyphomicrobiales bacterium]